MKKIQLEISDNRVRVPSNPIDKFKLNVRFMHGDADAYTDESKVFAFDRKSHLENFCVVLTVIIGYCENNGRPPRRAKLSELCETLAASFSVEETEDLLDSVWDMIPADITNEGSCAMIDEFTVTYFNNDGVEFKVDVSEVS